MELNRHELSVRAEVALKMLLLLSPKTYCCFFFSFPVCGDVCVSVPSIHGIGGLE